MIWREILKIILNAILFCANNNIALRASNEIIEDPNCSIILQAAGFEQNFQEVQTLAEEMGIEKGFHNKRKRRGKIMEIDETPNEESTLTPEELFKIQNGVLATLLSQIDWRYQKMKTICDDF
ncbi:hypothetical protein ILUMI_01101 [Ignelater luminosus]|uniref:Uncharacterized protein n=1 Tax=Ignelater luminosus TaxID=2038154 RepID=A0A8K0DKY4_IGNLU|nr:hypothetical protein ILUMI_01101 [Ignelater luminosus]